VREDVAHGDRGGSRIVWNIIWNMPRKRLVQGQRAGIGKLRDDIGKHRLAERRGLEDCALGDRFARRCVANAAGEDPRDRTVLDHGQGERRRPARREEPRDVDLGSAHAGRP